MEAVLQEDARRVVGALSRAANDMDLSITREVRPRRDRS